MVVQVVVKVLLEEMQQLIQVVALEEAVEAGIIMEVLVAVE